MVKIKWSDDLATGIVWVDNQHKQLISRIINFIKAVQEKKASGEMSIGFSEKPRGSWIAIICLPDTCTGNALTFRSLGRSVELMLLSYFSSHLQHSLVRLRVPSSMGYSL